jgi:hypothetical protein
MGIAQLRMYGWTLCLPLLGQELLSLSTLGGRSQAQAPPVRGARRRVQVPNDLGFIEEGRKAPKKQMGITLWGAWGRDAPCPLRPDVFTPAGWPAVSTPVLRALAGKPGAAKNALAELDGADTAVPEGGARPCLVRVRVTLTLALPGGRPRLMEAGAARRGGLGRRFARMARLCDGQAMRKACSGAPGRAREPSCARATPLACRSVW